MAPVAPVAAEEPPPDPPPARLGSPEIFGYLPYWSLDAQIDYSAITTIAYFGLAAQADGKLKRYTGSGSKTTEYSRWQGNKVNSIIDQAHANGVKFVLTVERMAWGDGSKEVTRALLGNPEARLTLADDIVYEITTRGLDGVSLDFEPILSDQRDNFALLLGEIRAALDAVNPAYQLTFAATGSQPKLTYEMFGNVTASGAADAVIIMGYPLRGISAKRAGGLAPVYSPYSYDLKQIVNAYLNRVAGDKVILALPWYGRQWPTQTDELNAYTQQDRSLYDRAYNINYVPALRHAIANGRRYDPSEQSAWTAYRWRYCDDCPETWREVYYEDVDSLAYKYDYAATRGLAGVGIWALGYDNDQPEMWSLLRVKYRGFTDTSPPSGSFGLSADERFCRAPRVALDFSLDDGAGSGAVYLRLSNQPSVGTDGQLVQGRTYPATTQISWPLDDPATGGSAATGTRTVYAQWRDVSGNWSSVSSTSFDVSSLAPTATVTVAAGADVVSSPTVKVKAVKTSGRSISTVRVSNSAAVGADGMLVSGVNGSAGTNINLSLIDPAAGGVDADGRRSVYVQWRDSAGCWSDAQSTRITLDRAAPVGSLSLVDAPSLSIDGNVQVLAPATDVHSGVAELALSNDGVTWQSLTPSNDPLAWTAGTTPDGPWTLSARWRDGAGNWSAPATTSLTLDRNGPVGTLVINGGVPATAGETVTVEATATDVPSGVAEFLLSNTPDMVDGVLASATSYAPGTTVTWSLPGSGTPEGVAEGTHTIYAQWRDTVGHWSAVASATVFVDRTGPTVTPPQAALQQGSQLGSVSVAVDFSWTATDTGSGVASEQLQLAREGEPWGAPAFAPSGASAQIDRVTPWYARVTATDKLGNVGVPVEGGPFTAQMLEENAANIVYKRRWYNASISDASGGATRWSKRRGAIAKLTFTGRSVAWVAPVSGKRGKAKVFIDGVMVAKVNLRASARQRVLVFSRSWATAGTHTIKIKVLGTAGRPRVDLDGLVVLN